MLADRQHAQGADTAAMHLRDEFSGGRHVAIFHRRPENARRVRCALHDPAGIVYFRRDRLFAENVQTGIK